MKNKIILFLFFTGWLCFAEMRAQTKQTTIIDDLETFVSGSGIVLISSDPKIMELIGARSPEVSKNEKSYIKANGFRMQVFMSNDSRTARKEIADKVNLIKGFFPEISIYTDYAPPNWKLLVGDFRSKEEAEVFKQKILKSIPDLKKEMYVVSSKINIPVQKY